MRPVIWLTSIAQGILRTAHIPADISVWESSWISRKIKLSEQIDYICHHSSTGLYVLGASQKTGFKLPEDDELHYEWKNEGKNANKVAFKD
jgi:cleavage and polyadenylation specificity factor subunit 1